MDRPHFIHGLGGGVTQIHLSFQGIYDIAKVENSEFSPKAKKKQMCGEPTSKMNGAEQSVFLPPADTPIVPHSW